MKMRFYLLAFLVSLSMFVPSTGTPYVSAATDCSVTICSFNIQFLGYSTRRDNAALANTLKDYDIVIVQELVAPPDPAEFPNVSKKFPDGKDVKADAEATNFFKEMKGHGFEFKLSEEDTGTGKRIHVNSSATEWFVMFYKPEMIETPADLPSGFLAEDRSNHADYERVPYAFPVRTKPDKALDFVLISVHLKPGKGPKSRARRKHELQSIGEWVKLNDDTEKDFIILGDMNIYKEVELCAATPEGFLSLNDECRATNTSPRSPWPYDHVMYRPVHTTKLELDMDFDLEVVDLLEVMKDCWDESEGSFPGEPYHHHRFRAYYSDHHPVVFRMTIPATDDDSP